MTAHSSKHLSNVKKTGGLNAVRYSKIAMSVMLVLFIAGLVRTVDAGEWRVVPIRVELGKRAKSGSVTIVNGKDEKLYLQIKAMEWIQNADGKDMYLPTEDIIFFPKVMVFEKKDEMVLRVGVKDPAVQKEKTYRVFIEEVPGTNNTKTSGAKIGIAIRFGLPVFLKPAKEEQKGEVTDVYIMNGDLSVVIKNSGNTHFRIETIHVQGQDKSGKELIAKDITGWYVLNGSTVTYTVTLPQEICPNVQKAMIEIKTDKFTLRETRDIKAPQCSP